MTEDKEKTNESSGGIFTCESCNLTEKYDYKGKNPFFSKNVKFLEDCYTMKDPFSPPNKHQFLILGSDCEICSKTVCQDSGCSFFYEKRFCLNCAESNINRFPSTVQLKVQKLISVKK